jgi:hypothetical protein
MVEHILSPARIVAHRIAVGEGQSVPELRDWYTVHGVAPAERLLTRYFAREQASGRLVLENPSIAASHFYMMVFGRLILQSVNGRMGIDDIPLAREEVRSSVSIFLLGVLPRA